jgi:hypothetical protein
MLGPGSTLTAVAGVLALLASGCEGDSGGAPADGSGNPGETTPDAGASGATPTALVKFCNTLSSQMGNVELALDFGSPPVHLGALTGTCAPQPGEPCRDVPAGEKVPVAIYLNRVLIGQVTADLTAGQEIVFRPALVTQNGTQGLRLDRTVQPPGSCPGIDR